MKRILSILKALVYPAVYMGMQFVVSMLITFGYAVLILPKYISKAMPEFNEAIAKFAIDSLLWVVLISALLSAAVFWGIHKIERRPFLPEIGKIKAKPATLLAAFAGGSLFNVFLTVLISVLDSMLHFSRYLPTDEALTNAVRSSNVLIPLVIVGIVVPIVEELTFRIFAYNRLKEGFAAATALILQGVIFGIVHIYPVQIIYAAGLGVLLGIALKRTRSFGVAALMHIGFNSAACLLDYVTAGLSEFTFETVVIALACGAAAASAYIFAVVYSPEARLKDAQTAQ